MASLSEIEGQFEEHKEHPLMQSAVMQVTAAILASPIAEQNLDDALMMIASINMRLSQYEIDKEEVQMN